MNIKRMIIGGAGIFAIAGFGWAHAAGASRPAPPSHPPVVGQQLPVADGHGGLLHNADGSLVTKTFGVDVPNGPPPNVAPLDLSKATRTSDGSLHVHDPSLLPGEKVVEEGPEGTLVREG